MTVNKTLNEAQKQALDLIFIDENCFTSIENAVVKFKSEITSGHSVGKGPYSIAALFNKLIDPAFEEFIKAFPSKLPQKSPPLSKVFREGLSYTDIYLNDLAMPQGRRGEVIARPLHEFFENVTQDIEYDADWHTINSTVGTLRYLVSACFAFQPKQKRKLSPYGLGRNNNSRVWVANREIKSSHEKLSNEKYREIVFSKYPFCKLCFRHCENFQSQISNHMIAGTNLEINSIPLSNDLDECIRPSESIEYCKNHARDRNARVRDRRLQPIFFALLSALIWLKKEKHITISDIEEIRELAYQEARSRTSVAKKVKAILKSNPQVSDDELGVFLKNELLNLQN